MSNWLEELRSKKILFFGDETSSQRLSGTLRHLFPRKQVPPDLVVANGSLPSEYDIAVASIRTTEQLELIQTLLQKYPQVIFILLTPEMNTQFNEDVLWKLKKYDLPQVKDGPDPFQTLQDVVQTIVNQMKTQRSAQ